VIVLGIVLLIVGYVFPQFAILQTIGVVLTGDRCSAMGCGLCWTPSGRPALLVLMPADAEPF